MTSPRAAFALALAVSLACFPSRACRAEEFRGENCAVCHAALRDRVAPPELPGGGAPSIDVAVIGGGLSGLSAAHFLNGFSVVVLEKEEEAGGQARTQDISAGSASAGGFLIGEPVGVVASLLKELGIRPRPVQGRVQRYLQDGRAIPLWWEPEGSARAPYPESVRGDFFRLAVNLEGLESDYSLTVPVENSDVRILKKYDRQSLWDYLERNYGSGVAAFGDLYSRFRFGAGAREISAAAGLMLLSAEMGPRYILKGGMGQVARSLAALHKQELILGALVDGIRADKNGVTVHYRRRGEEETLRVKAVLLAVPAHVALKIVPGLSGGKKRALQEVRTSAYVVVNLSLRKPVTQAAVLWTPGRYFAALVSPDSSTLAAYVPLGSGSGRESLLDQTDDQIRGRTLEELDRIFPGASGLVEGARVIRWGHALALFGPGFLSSLQPRLERPEGRIFFAGAETEAPTFEGAVYSGFKAARQVRLFLRPGSEPKERPVAIP